MRYAEVSVNSPAAQRRTFSYSIPSDLTIQAGQAVWVPFGERLLQGVVMELTEYPAVEETRDILDVIEPDPVLSPEQIELAFWISRYYLTPLFDAVSLMLPPGYQRKAVTFVRTTIADDASLLSYTPDKILFIEYLLREGRTSLKTLEKRFGQKKAQRLASWLVRSGHGVREYELEPVRARPKLDSYARLAIDSVDSDKILAELQNTPRTQKQAALYEFLKERRESVLVSEALRLTGCTRSTLDSLIKKGLVMVEQVEVRRDPLSENTVNLSFPLTLTRDQETAFNAIRESLSKGNKSRPDIFLLHGVTGSGKTEIYLQSLAETIRQGKRGIALVPEISLTPQTIERFASRFPGRVAILHSQLSLGERYDEWRRVRNNQADVVIGPRSAVFAPQPDLGLIILDEEHEWTYKQQDNPRYHARDVAVRLAELTGATVILGSATPDVESYYHSKNGDYQLLELPGRVTPYENTPLPGVEVIDLRDELKSGNRSMFSRSLSAAIDRALAGNEQVILFLNRRGAATYIQCRDCGFVLRCRRCDVSLTYHLDEDMLVCHQCNYRTGVPGTCPQCGSKRIKFLGVGTQKLEEEAKAAFPGARLLRWDSDTTRRRDSHRLILEKFKNHEADILIGTQMITKGLDLPQVTLVGVISSDTALNLPDFRSGERTFQLLTQVAGRAGRGPLGGQVIIQTYSPDHYAVRAAASYDYPGLYNQEIEYRRQLRYPPFSQLASMIFLHRNDNACQKEAERLKKLINDEINMRGISGMSIIGPAPAFIHRLRGRYRWQIVLRGSELSEFLGDIPIPQGWAIDIDPVGL
ncbi:MAG: primosomal protein N' [Chloroflexi bacterium RBG_13_46_14]|nr:MAG: primosomal protein N' [Chloroflexi bacterium RBG_13_46_14]